MKEKIENTVLFISALFMPVFMVILLIEWIKGL
jgi:hypothetical protein